MRILLSHAAYFFLVVGIACADDSDFLPEAGTTDAGLVDQGDQGDEGTFVLCRRRNEQECSARPDECVTGRCINMCGQSVFSGCRGLLDPEPSCPGGCPDAGNHD